MNQPLHVDCLIFLKEWNHKRVDLRKLSFTRTRPSTTIASNYHTTYKDASSGPLPVPIKAFSICGHWTAQTKEVVNKSIHELIRRHKVDEEILHF